MKQCEIGNISELDYSGTEALNTISSNLIFAGKEKKKIIFTSCDAGDGKTYTVLHLAKNLTKRGNTVCVVDADLRRSVMMRNYRIHTEDEPVGLAHYLAGYSEITDVVYETNISGLYLVPVGRLLVSPIQLLDTQALDDLLNLLASKFDFVLVDAPPVGLVVDAAVIAPHCDGCVLVFSYNKTRRREIADAQRQIKQSGCPILGGIINNVSVDSFVAKKYYNKGYYKHYYSKYYTENGKRVGESKKKGKDGKQSQ